MSGNGMERTVPGGGRGTGRETVKGVTVAIPAAIALAIASSAVSFVLSRETVYPFVVRASIIVPLMVLTIMKVDEMLRTEIAVTLKGILVKGRRLNAGSEVNLGFDETAGAVYIPFNEVYAAFVRKWPHDMFAGSGSVTVVLKNDKVITFPCIGNAEEVVYAIRKRIK